MLEYVLATGVTLAAVLVPFGDDRRSGLARLVDAIQDEHAGFLYAASVPAMPRGLIAGSNAPPGNDNGGADPASGDGAGASGPDTPAGGGNPGHPSPGNNDGGGVSSHGGSTSGSGDGAGGSAGNPADPNSPAPDSPLEPGHLVDADEDGDPGNGGGSCPAPGMDDVDNPFTSASQRTAVQSTHVGNPIHVVTGNKYQRDVDVNLPALQLAFVRHYNSRGSGRGVLGPGWTHGFEVRLRDHHDRATLRQADGRRIDFTLASRDDGVRRFVATQAADGRLLADRGGYEWRWNDGSVLSFDSARRLRQVRDAQGQVLRLVRDARGRIAQVVTDAAAALELHYDPGDRLIRLTASNREIARYGYDTAGRLERVEFPDRATRRYHYEDPIDSYNLTGISEGLTSQTSRRLRTWTYDLQDRATSTFNLETGERTALEFFGDGRRRVTTTGSASSAYTTAYMHGVPVVAKIDGRNCTPCAADAAAGDVTFTYDDRLNVASIATAGQGLRAYQRDAKGRLVSITQQVDSGHERTLLSLRYRGPTQDIERIARPSLKPGGEHAIELTYRDDGQIAERIETGFAPLPSGGWEPIRRRQVFGYEGRRLASVGAFTDDPLAATRIENGSGGAGTRVVFPGGGSLQVLDWDASGRPRRIQADDHPPLNLEYGADGKVSAVRRGETIATLEYGADGRIARLENAGTPGAVLDLTSPPRSASSIVRPPVPNNAAPRVERDSRGQVVSVAAANGAVTRYGIDDFGRRAFEVSADAGTATQSHDGENRLTKTTDASGFEVRLDHDPGSRLAAIHLPEHSIRIAWSSGDCWARPSSMASSDGSEQIETDEAGRSTRRIIRIGDKEYVSEYRYAADGTLITRTLPDGRVLRFEYDKNVDGKPTLISISEASWLRTRPLLTDVTWPADANGSSTWTTASGIQTQMTRDHGRLTRLRIGALHDFTFRYDALNRIRSIDDRDRVDARFRYDKLGRLDFALTQKTMLGFRYDANGNRTSLIDNGDHTRYRYASRSNRLAGTERESTEWVAPMKVGFASALEGSDRPANLKNSSTAHYRLSGETQSLGDLDWDFDSQGRISAVRERGMMVARYGYDVSHRRVSKHRFDPAGHIVEERHYLYDDGLLAAEADGAGSIQVQYLYLGSRPVAMLTAAATYFIHTDHLGAPIAMSDRSRRIVWRATYAPFGRATVDEDPDRDGQRVSLNLRLPGQYEDVETGIYYNHHRYYDPDLGRYLSPDPLGLAGGLNPYVYAGNDPINYVDPSGLLLFAFDGSGNNDPAIGRRDISNVVKFRDSYVPDRGELGVRDSNGDMSNQHYYYISGPGTRDARSNISGDSVTDNLTGKTMIKRVARLADDFFRHLVWMKINRQKGLQLNVDTIGFSRGAAEARIFVNLLTAFLDGEDHFILDHTSGQRYEFSYGDPEYTRRYLNESCVRVNLRFMGLWDSVPHYSAHHPYLDGAGTSQDDDLEELELQVDPTDDPNAIQYVAHAIAVNEDRRDFHAVSIHMHPRKGNTESRMEMGFIGAHADVGGGYAEGDLSDVALMWMVQRARIAGVSSAFNANSSAWTEVRSPVLHDSRKSKPYFIRGRNVKYLNDIDEIPQRSWYDEFPDRNAYGMTYRIATQGYFGNEYESGPPGTRGAKDNEGKITLVGIVNAARYASWLEKNYRLSIPMSEIDFDKDRRPPPAQR